MADPAVISAFLDRAGWGDARRTPLAGDASARSYERLTRDGDSAVLMKAAPGPELEKFLRIGALLAEAGFSTPRIRAESTQDGVLLLEDFGDALAARVVANDPAREAGIYRQITEFLLALQRVSPPEDLPLLDGPGLADLLRITPEFYPCHDKLAAERLAARIAQLYAEWAVEAPAICLRDFHAENIILLSRSGHRALGLLDFQDAVRCHSAYDLVSALQDARRDVSIACEQREKSRFAQESGLNPERFVALYALLGTQRALRILGIFARLCTQMGKPGYLAYMPRVWGYIDRNLTHPALAEVARDLRAAYPPPDRDLIARLEAACPANPPTP